MVAVELAPLIFPQPVRPFSNEEFLSKFGSIYI
jgi:hypothetical protein